jgi:hypothetical protein
MVTLKGKYNTEVEFIKTPTRPFLYIDISLDPGICQTTQVIKKIEQSNIKDAIVKLLYHVPVGKQDVVDMIKVEHALTDAWHLAGIVPIIMHDNRVQRGVVKTSMDFKTALTSYFKQKRL